MNTVLVVFRMAGGADVVVAMLDPNARIIIRDWEQGNFKGKFIGSSTDPLPWMVKLEDIQAIQALQNQELQQQGNTIPKEIPTSGVQNK